LQRRHSDETACEQVHAEESNNTMIFVIERVRKSELLGEEPQTASNFKC
jgi:hypothetical protein